MKILFVTRESKGQSCGYNRYEVLTHAINVDRKHKARLAAIDLAETIKDICDPYACEEDIIIIHSSILTSHYKMIQKWKANGKMIIADLCQPVWYEEMRQSDWPDQMDGGYTRELFSPTTHKSDEQAFRWSIRLVDGVICNSRRMADDWSKRTGVFYIPDFINLDDYLIHGFDPHPGIVIGIKVLQDGYYKLAETGLMSAIEAVGLEIANTKFLFYGDLINVYRKINLRSDQKIYIPARDEKDWQKVLSTIDLGLIPLSGNIDDRVGWCDPLEYMAMKIPWVGSSSIALADLRQYGWLVQNHDSIWKRVILDMVGNIPAYKEEAGGEPYLFAISQVVDEYLEKLYRVIERMQLKPYLGAMTGNVSHEYIARR